MNLLQGTAREFLWTEVPSRSSGRAPVGVRGRRLQKPETKCTWTL